MALYEFYQIFGQLVVIAGIILLILFSITILLGKILIKEDKLIFPRLLIFNIDLFYGFLKKFAEKMGINGRIIDEISVEVRNKVNEKSFKNIKAQDKIIVLPHCLRHADCEAKLGTSGIVCKNCNRCVIGVLKSKAEGLGYKVFIIPGSTFLKKIVEKNKFKGVLGVACYQDLNLSMMKLSKFSCQGVPLLRDGCVNTKVDTKAVLEKIGFKFKKPCDSCKSHCVDFDPRKSL
jgi:hypothetical protein